MIEKNIFIEEIGNVKFRKNKRSKNVTISIRPLQGIIVSLPYYISYNFAIKVVKKKKTWIIKNLPKIQKIENETSFYDENSNFKTKHRNLIITKSHDNKIRTKITPDSILIKYPTIISVENSEVQTIIKKTIVDALRLEAKEYLPHRTKLLSEKLNLNYNKVYIKNNKTLWGSCSAKNNINLNLHLMRLPYNLVDYVIIHELCHTVEKNHGDKFWQLMDSILGNAKKLSKEVKNYSIQIY